MGSGDSPAECFARAYGAHQAGDLATARSGYEAVLRLQPRHFDALHMLGVASLQAGDFAAAAQLIEQALRIEQGYALAWLNLASAYRGLGRHGDAADCVQRKIALAGADAATLEALADLSLAAGRLPDAQRHYARVLELDPRSSDAAVGLGIAQRSLGQPAEAMCSFERALALAPGQLRATYEIGITRCEQRRYAEALAHFDRVLVHVPAYAAAHDARALALWRLGRLDEAELAYGRAVDNDPGFAAAYSNRAALHASRGRGDLAEADYARAIGLQPRHAEAHNGLGALLAAQHRLDEAMASYRRAIDCRSAYAQAHNNLGVALAEVGRLSEAMASYDRAVELNDAEVMADALANRANLRARLRDPRRAAADARAALAIDPEHAYTLGNALYFESLQCDWRQRDAGIAQLGSGVAAGAAVATPFIVLTLCDDPALQLAAARRFAAANCAPQAEALPLPAPRPRLRIAFVSADFHEHATAYLIAGTIEQFDKTRFELFGLSYGPATGDPWQRRLQAAFDRFIDIRGQSDAQAAGLMRELGIDIAVDLKGFTNDARPGIFSHRAAPLQLAYLGYPGSSGMPLIDYLIADRYTVPAGHETHYSERIVRLPHCYQCNDAGRPIAERRFTRAELGLPEQGFVFCSFNNGYKITPEVFDVWMRLLRQVEGSVLWLLQDNPAMVDNLRREAAPRGVAAQRLVFAPRLPADEHLARHRCADLFLDTWPVNAHTTASDALWAGLPMITRTGRAFAGRVATSLLHAIGQADAVAGDNDAYEALALALARDPARLAERRDALHRARTSAPLFDTRRYTRDFEQALLLMHARHRAGLAPQAFDLPSLDAPAPEVDASAAPI